MNYIKPSIKNHISLEGPSGCVAGITFTPLLARTYIPLTDIEAQTIAYYDGKYVPERPYHIMIYNPKQNSQKGEKMLIGLISDTHDCFPMLDKVVEKLNKENVGLVLHAGDYVAPFTVIKFRELKAKLIGVFGNNDGDRELLKKKI